jgi:hypothetical protein
MGFFTLFLLFRKEPSQHMHMAHWWQAIHNPLSPERTLLFFPVAELRVIRLPTGNLRGKEGGFHLSVIAFHTFAEGHEVADGLGFVGHLFTPAATSQLLSFPFDIFFSASLVIETKIDIITPRFINAKTFPACKYDPFFVCHL